MRRYSLLAVIALSMIPLWASACDAIGKGGVFVRVVSESAIIVWDERNHLEHFIRIANFATEAKDLGFLVPSPTEPKLSEVRMNAFAKLNAIVKQRLHVEETKGDATPGTAANPVLSVSHVGGYEATVLSTANPKAIEDWLKSHGFPKSNATADWLSPYIEKHWVITAFRVEAKGGVAGLNPVRMSFKTDSPFYPYREPITAMAGESQRSLRVFFLGDGPVGATMGQKPWVGRQEMSDTLTTGEISDLAKLLPGVDLSHSSTLTSFIDTSSPREGLDEVYFNRLNGLIHAQTLFVSLPAPALYIAIGAVVIGVLLIVRLTKARSSN